MAGSITSTGLLDHQAMRLFGLNRELAVTDHGGYVERLGVGAIHVVARPSQGGQLGELLGGHDAEGRPVRRPATCR